MTIENKREMTDVVVNGVMSFLPTDPLQIMLASQAVGHHLDLLDGMCALNSGTLTPHQTARARASTIAQSRVMLAMVRECRIVRKERLTLMAADREAARAAAEAKPEAPAPDTPPARRLPAGRAFPAQRNQSPEIERVPADAAHHRRQSATASHDGPSNRALRKIGGLAAWRQGS